MHEPIQEFVDSRGLVMPIDRRGGIIRGVKILGVASQNGRTYLPEAIERAAPLYEGAKVNVNHAKRGPAGPRDYRDRIGVIRNVAARPGEGLFGDFHFNPRHALAEQLLWDAEHAPQNVGFSHNVLARLGRRGETVVVEEITKVQSVDLVADPATTAGLFESTGNDELGEGAAAAEAGRLESLTLDQLRQARPDMVEALLTEAAERIAALEGELDRLRLADQIRARRARIRRLLAESGLPDPEVAGAPERQIVSESFLQRLMQAGDEAEIRRLIEERAEMVRELAEAECQSARPVAREQNPFYHQAQGDVEAFVRAIGN
ncbi:MAG: hypothetical protein ACOX1P_32710 [Thermoguttaceae bacterium]|jgi:sulfur carrier protein ThiS